VGGVPDEFQGMDIPAHDRQLIESRGAILGDLAVSFLLFAYFLCFALWITALQTSSILVLPTVRDPACQLVVNCPCLFSATPIF
jgi:hypothetical protein